MTGKLARFSILAFSSFCFFTILFQTITYAQVLVLSETHSVSNIKAEPTAFPPTPTIFIASYLSPASFTSPALSQLSLTTAPFPQATSAFTIIVPTQNKRPVPTSTTSPIPTKIVTPTQSIPTTIPTTVPEPTSTPSITITTPASNGGLDPEKLFSMANAHRQSLGLPAFQKDEQTCSLARARAPEIAGEMAAGTLHSGMYGRNLPYWNTENAIAMGPEEAAFNWWLNEPVHRQAIESKTHTISCVACTGVYCVQEFTSYQQK